MRHILAMPIGHMHAAKFKETLSNLLINEVTKILIFFSKIVKNICQKYILTLSLKF